MIISTELSRTLQGSADSIKRLSQSDIVQYTRECFGSTCGAFFVESRPDVWKTVPDYKRMLSQQFLGSIVIRHAWTARKRRFFDRLTGKKKETLLPPAPTIVFFDDVVWCGVMRRRLETDGWKMREIRIADYATDSEMIERAVSARRIGFRPNLHTLRLERGNVRYEFSTEKNFNILYAIAIYLLVHRAQS